MARWEPNARERLQNSALELFLEQGYEGTTAAQIAERAGLAKSTFFRHFTDKREVLFGGQELLHDLFVDAIAAAPASATPLEAAGATLAAAATVFGPERRTWARRRQTVVEQNSELQERELLKLAGLTAATADALRTRGVPDPTAGLAAEIGALAFRQAFARWIAPPNQRDFADLAQEQLRELSAALPTLDLTTVT
ncbi:helix-turn-helix domain-containing protein [Asanoa sp. NPDC050611]|uniref:TetR/AcrR family transcriptional regulator n=1 Tax=Asanoa sp. NPDC050611 TaxID=3157098 RepID=UPI0033C9DC71